MKRLKLDDVRDVLPDLDELRPILDHLLARSAPDPARTWSGSGQLDTVGSRLVEEEVLSAEIGRLAEEEARHLGDLYVAVARAVTQLAARDGGAAAESLLVAAALEEGRDRPDRVEAYAASAYRACRDEKDQRPAALALRRWARAARSLGKLREAQERYVEAYEAARAVSDARGAAEAAVGAGNVLQDRGRWADADTWYRTALEALEGVGPAPERWHALLNLHVVTRSRGASEESVPWLTHAEEAAAEVDPQAAAPFIENAWGQLRMAEGRFGEAEGHLRRALRASTNAAASVTIRLNLAEALLAQNRTLDAAEHAREAEREAIRAGSVPKLPEVYRLLGRIASRDGDSDAFVLFERALDIIRERALPGLEEALTLQAYSESEARNGDLDSARGLSERARAKYEALGIKHMRHPWADVYGTAGDPPRGSSPKHAGDPHE